MELDYSTAIVVTVQAAIGYGFWRLAQYGTERIKQPMGRALLLWPCYGLGFLFLSSAAVTMLWNMVGPIVMWVWSLMA
jgi:hypothetical protein